MWPVARDLFRFGPLHADDLALTVAAGITCALHFGVFEGRLACTTARLNINSQGLDCTS